MVVVVVVVVVKKYYTISPDLLPALRASQPAYEYLVRLTYGYRHRAITNDTATTTDGNNDDDDGVSSSSSSSLYEDPRNADLLVWVGAKGRGRLVTRENAGVSPWDSSVQGGDAVWEGLRVYNGKILSFNAHLTRLYKSAKALHYSNIPPRSEIIDAVFRTLAANNMRDGAHLRLTLTRGEKYTSSMNPEFNVYGTTLIVLAEWKPMVGGRTTYDNSRGIRLVTCAGRRNSPSTCDSKVHHCNMINNILPKIQANQAGCADALMLDLNGFVSETNATNVFMVDEHGVLVTPTADHCLPGITRATVLFLAEELGIKTEVRNVSLAEFHAAEECFTTGTMGELTPVTEIDGRVIGSKWEEEGNEGVAGGGANAAGKVTSRLQEAYRKLPETEGWSTEIPPFQN